MPIVRYLHRCHSGRHCLSLLSLSSLQSSGVATCSSPIPTLTVMPQDTQRCGSIARIDFRAIFGGFGSSTHSTYDSILEQSSCGWGNYFRPRKHPNAVADNAIYWRGRFQVHLGHCHRASLRPVIPFLMDGYGRCNDRKTALFVSRCVFVYNHYWFNNIGFSFDARGLGES